MQINKTLSRRLFVALVVACLAQWCVSPDLAQGKLRKLKLGDKMPSFSLPQLDGRQYAYSADANEVLVIAFVSSRQKHSERVCLDLAEARSHLHRHPFRLAAIASEAGEKEYFQAWHKDQKLSFPILLDAEYHFWGEVGVIATPTVMIVACDGTISWIKAGYGYDFASALELQLHRVLGIDDKDQAQQSPQVATLDPGAVDPHVHQHLNMARMMAEKGHLDPALKELRKAEELAPESNEVLLALGRLLCLTEQSEEALATIEKVKTDRRAELALVKMLSGWAQRQLNNLPEAEKLLRESLELKPTSPRTLFELGRIHQARKEQDKALDAYDRALTILFKENPSLGFSR